MSGWQNSRSTDKRHKHVTRMEGGREVCIGCLQVIVNPIIASDDSRLEGAGLQRTTLPENELEPIVMPLPAWLLTLWEDGPEYGFMKAPCRPPYLAFFE